MKLKTFRITLNNSTSPYTPGQDVSGEVVIDPGTREVETQGLVLEFQGSACVHWTKHRSHGTRTARVNYDGSSNVYNNQIYLSGDGRQTLKLSQGETAFTFTFALPSLQIPGSFEGKHGKVEYVLKATLKQKRVFGSCKIEKEVLVAPVLDLNLDPVLAQPITRKKSKTFGLFLWVSGPLTMSVKVGAKGFSLGENLPFLVEVKNGSTRKIKNMSALLLHEVTYKATGKEIRSYEELAKATTTGPEGGPGDSEVWGGILSVPHWAMPTRLGGGCAIIDVRYYLEVVCHTSGLGSNLQLELPITIGTVPFRSVDLSDNSSNSLVPGSVLTLEPT